MQSQITPGEIIKSQCAILDEFKRVWFSRPSATKTCECINTLDAQWFAMDMLLDEKQQYPSRGLIIVKSMITRVNFDMLLANALRVPPEKTMEPAAIEHLRKKRQESKRLFLDLKRMIDCV